MKGENVHRSEAMTNRQKYRQTDHQTNEQTDKNTENQRMSVCNMTQQQFINIIRLRIEVKSVNNVSKCEKKYIVLLQSLLHKTKLLSYRPKQENGDTRD